MTKQLVEEFAIKSFEKPDNLQELPGLRLESVQLGTFQVHRMTFKPGWRWTDSLPDIMGTDTCEFAHPVWMVLSGRFAVQMNDGRLQEYGPGDLGMIPPGHDAWVVGDEPVVAIDIQMEQT